MNKTHKLQKVVHEIFVQMYEEAQPPAAYPSGVQTYEDHYLEHERQMEIIDEICRLRRVAGNDKKQVIQAVCMGHSPNTTPILHREDLKRALI